MTDLKDRKGIYVRIGYPDSEVSWVDGHQVIDKAYQDAAATGDSIAEILLTRNHVINLHNLMFDEYGVFLGRKVLRSITVMEAVRFLGRYLQICRFLITQEEAIRFAKLLEEGIDPGEHLVAREIRLLIPLLPERVPHLVPKPKMPVNTPVSSNH